MLAVLALMGVSFDTPKHIYTPFEGKGVTIEAGDNALLLTKQVREGQADLKSDIMVA
jgi:hypothetical protein